MREASLLELVNKDLDGVATAKEVARLKEILARDEEARKVAESLRAVARELASVKRAVPPPTLRPAVLRSLAAPPARSQPGWWRLPWMTWKPSLVFAGGAVAGVLLCLLGWWLVVPGSPDERDLVGSLTFHTRPFTAASVRDFSEGSLRATVASAWKDGEAIVRIRLDVPAGAVVSLLYDRAEASVLALDVPPGMPGEIRLAEGEISVRGVAQGEVGVLFSGKGKILPGIRVRLADITGKERESPLEGGSSPR